MIPRMHHRPASKSFSRSLLFSSLLGLAALSAPARVQAHGGLPVSAQLLPRANDMMVVSPYWGVFIGHEGGEWRWVCEEAINLNQQRRMALSSDGQSLYATDRSGLTLSPDAGCSWAAATGPIAVLDVMGLATDPVTPARAYALANDSKDGSQTGLWKTEDRGQTWTQHIPLPSQLPAGLAITADGQKVGATAITSSATRAVTLYEIGPTGGLQTRMLTFQLDGETLISAAPLAYEGSDLYLRTNTDTGSALHRLAVGTTIATRLLKIKVAIHGVLREPQNNQLLVATAEGIHQQQADQTFKLLPTLSATQCLSVQGGALYACGWNYAPDLAAIAKLGPGQTSFTKVFQFADTKGPIDCPASTPVAKICPSIWASYADQLGVMLPKPGDMSEPLSVGGGCSCDVTRQPVGAPLVSLLGGAGLAALALLRRLRRV